MLLDPRNAFGTVHQANLLSSMEELGIRRNKNLLIKSYPLENSRIIAYINNATSERNIINKGVPQGSVLDPLSYILYVNDTQNLNRKGDR